MSEAKILTPEQFKTIQEYELQMLVELDRVCRTNDIHYTIWGGTLLGAVRHKGFIPWDDDADVVMLREDYEKLKKSADQFDPGICYFQDHDTDSEYRWGFGKLRKTGTKYVRVGQEHLKCNTGVFVDIFPLDDVPLSFLGQALQDFHCTCLRKIMWSEVGKYSAPGLLKAWYRFLSLIPIDAVFKSLATYTKKSRSTSPNKVRTLCFRSIGKLYYKHQLKDRYGMPKKWFLERTDYDFEGKQLTGVKDYDECLTFIFGDYMQLPPVEKREQHSPVSDIEL